MLGIASSLVCILSMQKYFCYDFFMPSNPRLFLLLSHDSISSVSAYVIPQEGYSPSEGKEQWLYPFCCCSPGCALLKHTESDCAYDEEGEKRIL